MQPLATAKIILTVFNNILIKFPVIYREIKIKRQIKDIFNIS